MKGTIRPIGRQSKCPNCNIPFEHVVKLGYICKKCRVTPTKFCIDISWSGKRVRIYADKQGMPLDTYQRAINLQSKIQYEIDNHIFDIAQYSKADLKKYWAITLLDHFYEGKIKSVAPSYIRAYGIHVRRHKEFFKNIDVREIRKIDIINYKEHLQTLEIKDKTVKNTIDNFKTFMNWLKNDLELIDKVPPFPKVEYEAYQWVWFDSENQAIMLESIKEEDRPIVVFLMLTGCRPGEARALKVKHVDLKRKTITISSTFSGEVLCDRRKGRGAKPVEVPIHPEMFDFFNESCKNHPEAFIFINPRTSKPYSQTNLTVLWSVARSKANIPSNVRLYDASRHSFCSQLANMSVSPFHIQKLAGHSSIKTTLKYMHEDTEKLRVEVSKLTLQTVYNLSTKEKNKD
ncbi:MAG: site-specific integrase [Nitrospirae bacterium]|nr:site-specific integrase [Nitrospirota bacterium]